jgi:putative FmdB family regulatory protein
MPLYDYRCERCGDFREFRPMAQSGAAGTCPGCGGRSERLMVAPYLGADPSSRFGQRPAGPPSVRAACGHGCTHPHHRH